MSAPTPTARVLPTGFKMPDGFKSFITLKNKPNIQLWEVTVKPGALDAGELIPTSTMHNIRWHTGAVRKLIKKGPTTMTCMFDPDVHADIIQYLGVNDTVTETYPDGSTLCYYAALSKFEPPDLKEGDPPHASVTFEVTNTDPTDSSEAGPVFTPAAGT